MDRPLLKLFSQILLPGLLALPGCHRAGDTANLATGAVRGTVTLSGQPIKEGTVLLEKTDHSVAVIARISSDGSFIARTYEGADLPVGEYRVAITPTRKGETDGRPLTSDAGSSSTSTGIIPQQYRQLGTSGLKITVTKEAQSPFKLELIP